MKPCLWCDSQLSISGKVTRHGTVSYGASIIVRPSGTYNSSFTPLVNFVKLSFNFAKQRKKTNRNFVEENFDGDPYHYGQSNPTNHNGTIYRGVVPITTVILYT